MVLLAVQEWARYGRQTTFYPVAGPSRTEQQGETEREAPQRINDYWKSVDRPHLTGLDTEVPWSAAFISWDIQSAGVSHDLFCPDARHNIYVERMVARASRPGAAFVPRPHRARRRRSAISSAPRAIAAPPAWTTSTAAQAIATSWSRSGPGGVHAIGGNVSDSVTLSNYPLDAEGFLRPLSGHPVFTVIENRLP